MRSSKRSLTRASSIGFGTLFLAVSYACSERAVAPTATDDANEFAVSGILSTSLWRVDGSQLSYVGSVSAQTQVTQDKSGVHPDIGPLTTSEPSAPPMVSTQRFGPSLLQVPSTNKLTLGDDSHVWLRPKFTSPRVILGTRDGRSVSLQRVADPRGGGRPPIVTMLYDGDKPVSMIQAVYARDGKSWKATRARVTIFGKDGEPSAVTENDFGALRTASVAMPGTAAVLVDGFRRVGGSLSRLIQPDALYAASGPDDDGERCARERALMIAAGLAQVAADLTLGLVTVACATTGVSCPAVLPAALTAAATLIVYISRVIDYDQCMNPPPAPILRIADGGGGGGGGGEGDGCYDVDWEISYDGWTWRHYSTQRVCERQYEM